MRSAIMRKTMPRLAALALGGAALAYGPSVWAQVPPGSVQEGLHVGSPPSVLDDPVVKRCRLLAARRTDPKITPGFTAVENAAMELRLEPVFDAVATCRAALAAYPNEPKVIIAHYTASEALSTLVFGLKFSDSAAEALTLTLQGLLNVPGGPDGPGGAMMKQMMAFYVASASEYGVGAKPDRAAAMKWYAVAAEAGDAISKRELARLQAAKPSGPPPVGLHVDSPSSVLDDPVVKHCRLLAARRTDPNIEPESTAVEKALYEFKLEPVFDAVATCRAALAAYPNEPKVIIAHYNASEALSMLALGLKFPDSETEALALALQEMANVPGGPDAGMLKQALAFYAASAYEYGVGTRPDRAAAMKWYAVAAEAGDAISKRELARLQAARP